MPLVLQRVVTPLVFATVALACASQPSAFPSRPATPAGWTTVEVATGDVRMALPPWLVAFETSGPLFANEPPEEGATRWMEMIAEGPRTARPQPAAGEPLDAWLWRKLGPRVDRTGGSVRRIDLPSGSGVAVDLLLQADTPLASRLAAYAIRTPAGVAFLLIEEPPAAWVSHATDASLIPLLMELGPGRSGCC